MSYPGYPSYPPQGGGQAGSQPPQAPMYQTAPLSYPVYPGSAAPQPGYSSYPSPYPPANPGGPYPASGAPYPSGGVPYPATSSPYPPSGGAHYPGAGPASTPYPSGAPTSTPYPGGAPTSTPYPGGAPTSTPYPGGAPTSSQYPSGAPTGSPYPGAASSGLPYPGATPYSSGASPQPQSGYPGSNQYPGSSAPAPSMYPSYPPGSTTASSGSSAYPGLGGGRATSAPLSSQPHLTTSHSTSRTPTPTVRPANPFNARADAEILRRAMKGFGTDEKAIIEVLTKRSNAQRQQIAIEFKTLYGKDLISDLMSETSGKLEDLLVALMTPIPDFLARELKHAISGLGTKEETLVEIICSSNNYEMKCIKAAYERLFGLSLEQDLGGDTSGNFRRLLVSLCQANRSENYGVDPNGAFNDAQALMRAGELRLGTDESTFNAILASRSYPQLAAIFSEYQRLTGKDFESVVKSEFSGDIEAGLVAIVRSVRDKAEFFADQLYLSTAGAGTHDRALIRIICVRSEHDLGDIKVAFQRKYGKMLSEAIQGDTSGDYKKALLSLVQ